MEFTGELKGYNTLERAGQQGPDHRVLDPKL
jgi:hypothetical protein